MLTREEIKLLEVINERKLVRKTELEKLLEKVDGVSFSLVSSLLDKGLIANISPLGENTFIITTEGIKALKEETKL